MFRRFMNGNAIVAIAALWVASGAFAGDRDSKPAYAHPADGISVPPRLADIDSDGQVTIFDLAILLSHFGMEGADAPQGDLDGNKRVDIVDLAIMLAEFGQ